MAKNKTINMVKSQVIYKDYSKDAERTALVSGENLAHMFGKIARWYTDISWVGHTHTEANITDFGTYAGASTKGGAATSANKLNIGASDIGSETKPVYFNATTGKPVACAYSLNASVPANAVFTDINVKQSPSTANESREVLFAGNTGNTETTGTVGKSNKLYFNPNTGALTATSFSGSVDASNLTGSIDAGRLPTTSVTAGSYGPAAGGTLAHGGTFDVGYVTVDKYGRLTGASTKTFTLPAQYVHPSYTSKTSGLYKITVDGTGHVSGTAAVTAADLPSHTHDYLPTTTKYAISDSVGGVALSSYSNHLKFNNEMNFSKLSATGHVWFGYRWDTDGTIESGSDIDLYVTRYKFGNASGNGQLAEVEASSFIGNASSANIPYGFSSRATSASWTVGGTFVTGWDAGNGCEIAFVKDYPASKQLSCCIDGYFFQNEGKKRVLDEANYSSYITPAGIGALSTSTKYALSETVGGPAISATAIKFSHGNEVNFSKLGNGYEDVYFGWRWREADGSESSDANAGLNCYHFLKGGGTGTYAAIKASEFRGIATSAYRLTDTAITIKTGSSNQSHISMETLINWLVSQGVIPNNTNVSIVIPVGWAYANNDILQASINGTSYEIQLAGVIIEFHGYVNTSTDYLSGVYRFRIHSSPTKSFTPASGYTQFPTSSIAEFFCNGSGYSPTWKMFASTSETSNYVLKTGDTMTGNLKVDTNIWIYGSTRGAILRSDNSHFYILLTDSGSPTSTWNSLRPLYINESNGYVYMHEGVEITKGLTYVESGSAIMTIKSNDSTSAGVEFIRNGNNYTDYRILNNAGTFRIQCDYTNTHVDWFDVLNISNNVGNMSVRGAGTFGGAIYAVGGTMTDNLKIQESKSIMLRKSNDNNYVAGIGYDTQGNECIALWAKNTVTRLRWYAGTDMSDTVYTKMMSITPDFEVSKASGEPWAFVGGVTLDFYKCSLQVDNRENFASYQWHKFAEITTSSGYGDFAITFLFTQTYNDSRNSGILTARLRTNGNCLYQDASLEWHLAGPNIITDNFVLVYTDNSSNSTCKVELWYKQTARYNGYFFKVLRETTRSSRTPYYWTVFNNNDTGSATYTSGTGTKVSTIMNILNTSAKLSTNAGSNTCPVYFSGGVPVACKQVASGAYFSIVPFVRSDGVMEIGRYIDFHTTNASTSINYRINQWTTDSIEFDSRGTNNRVNIYTPGEGWAQLSFQVSATNKAFTASGIRVRPLTNSGTVMQIECSGNMVIGSGESPSTLYSNSYDNLDTSETERLYLASDNEIYFITNAQTYAGVKRLIIDKSGNLKIQQDQHVVQLQNSSGNYTSAIKWWSGGTDPGNYGPEIGQHNIGDTDGSICILPYNTTTSPWGGSVGLFISKTRLLYNGTAVSLNGHTHTYLIDPGQSSYKIEVAWAGASVPATDTTTYPAVFTKYNLTSGISVRVKESSWDAYKTFLGLGSAAYTASSDYATASHNHDSLYVAKSMIDVSTTTSLGLDGAKNAFGYVSGLTKAAWNNNQTDGVIIRQFYNASWKTELFIDYRTGQTSVRGKNNGTFTDWGSFAILKNDGSYWGLCSPSGANNVWIRTTTLGIIPYQSGAAGSGHCGLGTSSWYFSYAYIDNIYGTLHGNASTASEVGTVVSDPSSNTAYGITFVVDPGTSENNTIRKTNCFRLNHSVGAANTEGITEIVLGNSTAKTAANNSSGQIAFYNSNGKYAVIKPNTNSSNVTLYLPSSGGTLALVGDNNHTHSQYLSSSTVYAKGVTQNGDAVTAQSLRVTHGNEINASKPGDYTYIWFFYRWNDGGTEDTSGSKYIDEIYFGNGNGAGTNTSVGRFADLRFNNITAGTLRHTGGNASWWNDRNAAMLYQSYGDSNYRPTWGTSTKDDGSWCCGNYNNNNLVFNYIPYSVYNSGQNPTLYKQIIFTDDAKIEARGYNVINNGSGRLVMDYSGIELTNSRTGTWAAGIDMKNASGTLLSAIGFYGSDTALTYTYLGGSYDNPIIKLETSGYATFKDGMKVNNNISLQETKNIILRPNHSSYTAGIGYDTSGNECIAIWAKNSVTRLRWNAGTEMSTMTSGTMMGITPDFEISKASGTAKGYIAGDSIIVATAASMSLGINALSTGSSYPTDNDYYISQYVGGGTSTTSYHRRPHSALWEYIRQKISNSGGFLGHTQIFSGSTAIAAGKEKTIVTVTTDSGSQDARTYFVIRISWSSPSSDATFIIPKKYNTWVNGVFAVNPGGGAPATYNACVGIGVYFNRDSTGNTFKISFNTSAAFTLLRVDEYYC